MNPTQSEIIISVSLINILDTKYCLLKNRNSFFVENIVIETIKNKLRQVFGELLFIVETAQSTDFEGVGTDSVYDAYIRYNNFLKGKDLNYLDFSDESLLKRLHINEI